MSVFLRATRLLSQISGVASAALILVGILVVCQMIFVRAVLGQSAIWQTEFVTFSLIAATFLGAPYILLTRGHVNVDLLPLALPPAARKPLAFVAAAIGLFFCALFFWNSVEWWFEAWDSGQRTSSMWRARLWIPYLSAPVGLGLLCLQYVAEILAVATDREHPFGLRPEDTL
ncbi:MAG: TRAP transporter small permease [Rhizobiales bacterium]|nr:TRAP transporter small permease [Hyphomicrobiales bacterium]